MYYCKAGRYSPFSKRRRNYHKKTMSVLSIDISLLNSKKRSNQGTCVNQRPIVNKGERVEKGQVLADGPATADGEVSLGKNALIGFHDMGRLQV